MDNLILPAKTVYRIDRFGGFSGFLFFYYVKSHGSPYMCNVLMAFVMTFSRVLYSDVSILHMTS